MKKRRLGMLLVVVGMLIASTTAFAAGVCKIGSKEYDSLQAAVTEAKNGQTITVTKAITTSDHVEVPGKAITINFSRKKYVYNGNDVAFGISPGSDVTVKNLKMEGTKMFQVGGKLTISSGSATCDQLAFVHMEASALTIKKGTFTGRTTDRPLLDSNGILKIKNGSFLGKAQIHNRGTLTITKCTFRSASAFGIQNHGKATISDGTYVNTEGHCVLNEHGGTFLIKNGSFDSKEKGTVFVHGDSSVRIEGGTFLGRDTFALNCNGTCDVYGGTFRDTEKTRAAYAGNGSLLNIHGGTFYGRNWFKEGSTVNVSGGSFKGDGTISCEGKATFTGGKSNGALVSQGKGKVTVKKFTIQQKPSPAAWGDGGSCLIALGGTITVKGGKFTSTNGWGYTQAGGKVVFKTSKDYKKLFQVEELEYKG